MAIVGTRECFSVLMLRHSFFFQCVNESIIEDIPDVKVYIDDILIMTETKEELHQKLSQVRDKLKDNNLVINEFSNQGGKD